MDMELQIQLMEKGTYTYDFILAIVANLIFTQDYLS